MYRKPGFEKAASKYLRELPKKRWKVREEYVESVVANNQPSTEKMEILYQEICKQLA